MAEAAVVVELADHAQNDHVIASQSSVDGLNR